MSPRPVVVVGLMGSGKTTVARQLAGALGRPVRDSDEDLQARYGASAAEQYADHGAAVLHEREAEQLRRALASSPAPVVAAAASIIDDPACRAALRRAFVVWLDAPAAVLADRIGGKDHRPHYDPDPHRMLARQHRQRAARFRAVADLCLDASERSPQQVVEAVLAALSAAGRGGPAAG
jgi:shikimate kinase